MVHLAVCSCCDWLDELLWHWFFDGSLKSTVFDDCESAYVLKPKGDRNFSSTYLLIEYVCVFIGRYWNNVKREATQISQSLVQAQQREKEEADTVTALASLSMGVVKESDK